MQTHPAAFLIGVAILLIVVWDAFEVIILPRRVTRRFRLSRLFYKNSWRIWKFVTRLVPSKKVRESAFGISTMGAGQLAQSERHNSNSSPRGNGRWSNPTISTML